MAFNPLDPRTWGQGAGKVGRAAMAVNPFDPRNTNRAGQALGNLISRNRRAESIVNTIGRRGGTAVAGGVRNLTGVGGFQRGATKAQQGDIRGALASTAEGALNLGLSAAGVGRAVGMAGRFGTQGAYQAARAGGSGILGSTARAIGAGVFGDPASRGLRAAATGRSFPVRAGAAALGFFLPGSPFERAVVTPLTNPYIERGMNKLFGPENKVSATGSPLSRTGTRGGTYTDAAGRVMKYNPLTGISEVVGFQPQKAKASFFDKEGRYNVYNPRLGIYEVAGFRGTGQPTTAGGAGTPATPTTPPAGAAEGAFTVPGTEPGPGMFGDLPYEEGVTTMAGMGQGAGGQGRYSQELAAMSPEEMQQLLEASREAQRQYDETINQLGRTTAETERDFFDYMRGVNRQVAGGRQNVASQLAQLGMDTSPATQAYAEYLGAQGQRQIAGGRAKVADVLAQLRGQRGTAEAEKLRRMREIDMAMRNARARRTVDRIQR